MRTRPRWNWLPLVYVAIAAGALLGARGVAAEDEEPLPDWIPSIGVGPGIHSRQAEGTVEGLMKTETSPNSNPSFVCFEGGFCEFFDNDERDIDGSAVGVSAQLLGPSVASWPLRPRPFIQAAWVRPFSSRVLAEDGFQPQDFTSNFGEPDVQLELNADPQMMWYVGGGGALQLPFERPIFIKLGMHYAEERLDILGRVQRGTDVSNSHPPATIMLPEGRHKDKLTVRSLGPDIGLEVEVYRFGPIAAQLSADVLLNFPINSVKNTFDVDEPLTQAEIDQGLHVDPAVFTYDAENVQYYGTIYIRFAWLGR